MSKRTVAVICGGYTAEKNISLMSGEVVFRNIDRDKYEPFKVIVDESGWYDENSKSRIDLNDFSLTIDNRKIKFDCVFNAIHGSPGEDGKIQGYFDMLKIPYSNCGALASAVTFNKFWTKEIVRHDVPMAKDIFLKKGSPDFILSVEKIKNEFNTPVFVKPNNNGSSYGVSKVNEMAELDKAISEALNYDTEVLIEEGITGVEVTCGVYRHNGSVIALPICEIVTSKHGFFDYTAKYTSGESDEIIPARISKINGELVKSNSIRIYNRLNCKGVVRIDYIIKDNIAYMLEVNTVPGLSEASIVPKMARAAGYSLSQFFDILISESFSR